MPDTEDSLRSDSDCRRCLDAAHSLSEGFKICHWLFLFAAVCSMLCSLAIVWSNGWRGFLCFLLAVAALGLAVLLDGLRECITPLFRLIARNMLAVERKD